MLLLRITHQLNQNHSRQHTTNTKNQLQLNHIYIAASLSDKKINDRHLLSSTSLPNRTVIHHALEFGGNVDHANVTRTSDKLKYVPHLGNSLHSHESVIFFEFLGFIFFKRPNICMITFNFLVPQCQCTLQ